MSDKKKSLDFIKKTKLYQEYIAEKQEILKHKWCESKKAGYDIGYDMAYVDWEIRHYHKWKEEREEKKQRELSA